MNEPDLTRLTVYYSLAIGGGLTMVGLIFRKPLERLSIWLGADPAKGFKAIFLVFLGFYIIIAVVMSCYVAWRIFNGAGPFGLPLPTPTPTPTATPAP